MNKPLVILAVVAGIVFIGLAVLYFATAANSLPHFLPGYDPELTKHHYKHGIGSLLLGLALFAYAWFASAEKSPEQK